MIEKIGEAAMLEQLAEESAELAQAALKKARVIRGENPTDKTLDLADANLEEEFSDVVQCARELHLEPDEEQIKRKEVRFSDRWKKKVTEE